MGRNTGEKTMDIVERRESWTQQVIKNHGGVYSANIRYDNRSNDCAYGVVNSRSATSRFSVLERPRK